MAYDLKEDYYSLLGVKTDAASDEIRKAYKELAKKFHPDNFPLKSPERAEAEEVFSKITKAYKVLSSEKDRKNYDELLAMMTQKETKEAEKKEETVQWDQLHFERGRKELKSGQYEKAIESFREAIRLNPSVASYHSNLGLAYLRKGWKGYAKGEFSLALQLNPRDHIALQHQNETDEGKGILGRLFGKK